jgi:hypothetical protein
MRRSRPAGMAAMLIGVPVGASGQNTNGCVRRRKCHRLVIDRASNSLPVARIPPFVDRTSAVLHCSCYGRCA